MKGLIVAIFILLCGQPLLAQSNDDLDSLGAKEGLQKEVWFYENALIYDCPTPGGYMIGNFTNGRKDGEWTFYYSNGPEVRMKIIYKVDRPIKCTEFYRNRGRKIDAGTLLNGCGTLKAYDYYGNLIYECPYNNGLKEGKEIIYQYRNKKTLKINEYVKGVNIHVPEDSIQFNKLDANGAKTGMWIEPHFEEGGNEKLESPLVGYYKGIYTKGKKDGLWIDYYPNGNIRSKAIYEKNLLWTAIEYRDAMGNDLDPSDIKNGTGTYKIYSFNGKLGCAMSFSNGMLCGKGATYYDNGTVATEFNYMSPNDYQRSDYNEKGILIEKCEYKNNRPYGVDSIYNERGILKEYTIYNNNGNRRYDERGNIIEEIIWNKDGSDTVINYNKK